MEPITLVISNARPLCPCPDQERLSATRACGCCSVRKASVFSAWRP